MTHILSWCEGFLTLDEVTDGIFFAHPTMKYPVIQYYEGFGLFRLADADKEVGEICVTYLNFNDLKTQLSKPITPDVTSKHIITASLQTTGVGQMVARPLEKLTRTASPNQKIGRLFSQYMRRAGEGESQQHPFLAYATKHWLSHSSNFAPEDRIWPLWRCLIQDDDEAGLPSNPWTVEAWSTRDTFLCSYIVQYDHVALWRLMQTSKKPFSQQQLNHILGQAVIDRKFAVFDQLCKDDDLRSEVSLLPENWLDPSTQAFDFGHALQSASRKGYREIVRLFIRIGADVNRRGGKQGSNALYSASKNGHRHMVEVSLAAGANPDARGGKYGSALQAAARNGHVVMVKMLLDNGVDVNAVGGEYGTAPQAASSPYANHSMLVELLLEYKADVRIRGGRYGNAIEAARVETDSDILELLLDAEGRP